MTTSSDYDQTISAIHAEIERHRDLEARGIYPAGATEAYITSARTRADWTEPTR